MREMILIEDKFKAWEAEAQARFDQLKANEEELNKIFIDLYGLQDEMDYHVKDSEVSVSLADREKDIKSLISYAVGCMFGRYSLDVEGLVYAGGEFDASKYTTFKPVENNLLLITETQFFDDPSLDIVEKFIEFVSVVYGKETLEDNLQYIADTLKGTGTSREIIRRYFVKDFYSNHLQIYKKRPIYWQFDSGKENGFKALMYLHRYDTSLLVKTRDDYLTALKDAYIERTSLRFAQKENTASKAEAKKYGEELQVLEKKKKELETFRLKLNALTISPIDLDLDDGVVVNYEKLQTDYFGTKYQILSRR